MKIKSEFVTILNVRLTVDEANVIYKALTNYASLPDEEELKSNLTAEFGRELERETELWRSR